MATDIRDFVAKAGVTSAEKMAAIGADGQYNHNAVPEKLVQSLEKECLQLFRIMGPG